MKVITEDELAALILDELEKTGLVGCDHCTDDIWFDQDDCPRSDGHRGVQHTRKDGCRRNLYAHNARAQVAAQVALKALSGAEDS